MKKFDLKLSLKEFNEKQARAHAVVPHPDEEMKDEHREPNVIQNAHEVSSHDAQSEPIKGLPPGGFDF